MLGQLLLLCTRAQLVPVTTVAAGHHPIWKGNIDREDQGISALTGFSTDSAVDAGLYAAGSR